MGGTGKNILNRVFASKRLNSRIRSADVTKRESWLGFFAGPCMVSILYCMLGGSYLTQFYTDVLGLSGAVLVLMPFFSKIIDAFTNIMMGRIIDRTRTAQGKARPWILIAGVLIVVTGILLYSVPRASLPVQILWVVISYNLFYAFAYTIYNMSHTLMMPLSTRNAKQRDELAVLSNAGVSMIPGLVGNLVMPFLIRMVGVGTQAQGKWVLMMSLLSIVALPGVLLEYFFTKERVTEETLRAGTEAEGTETIPFRQQARTAFQDPYWRLFILITAVFILQNFLSTHSMIYYCNWVLANSVSAGTGMQFMVNVIGQAPLGIGIFALWPLVRKFGKRRVLMIGFTIAAIGSAATALMSVLNLGLNPVLGALIVRSVGQIPYYVMSSILAEALDHIEWKHGIRVDGFSAAIYSIIMTVFQGIGQSILLGGINLFGYISPDNVEQQIAQPAMMKFFFIFTFVGASVIAFMVIVILLRKYDLEKKMPQISEEIRRRREAAAEPAGKDRAEEKRHADP